MKKKSPTTKQPSPNESGFTLLEVLVALVIVGISLELVVRSGSFGLTAARREHLIVEAVARAQSHLAELNDPGALVPGVFTGPDGGGFTYILRVTRVDVARPLRALRLSAGVQALETALYRVEVEIAASEEKSMSPVVLSSYAIAPLRP